MKKKEYLEYVEEIEKLTKMYNLTAVQKATLHLASSFEFYDMDYNSLKEEFCK